MPISAAAPRLRRVQKPGVVIEAGTLDPLPRFDKANPGHTRGAAAFW